jgi:hypothetical protein
MVTSCFDQTARLDAAGGRSHPFSFGLARPNRPPRGYDILLLKSCLSCSHLISIHLNAARRGFCRIGTSCAMRRRPRGSIQRPKSGKKLKMPPRMSTAADKSDPKRGWLSEPPNEGRHSRGNSTLDQFDVSVQLRVTGDHRNLDTLEGTRTTISPHNAAQEANQPGAKRSSIFWWASAVAGEAEETRCSPPGYAEGGLCLEATTAGHSRSLLRRIMRCRRLR